MTYKDRRKQQDRLGMALICLVLVAFAGLLYGAAKLDEANGVTVSESLASWGIGGRPGAREARLLGDCGGRILAAMEESDFPAGCKWIERINLEGE